MVSIAEAEDQRKLGNLALYGFLLERNEKKQIHSFNEILSEMGLSVRLKKKRGKFYWTDDVTGESVQAEQLFEEIIGFIPEEKIHAYLDQGRFNFLLEQYDDMIHAEMRRIETLRWLSEFPD